MNIEEAVYDLLQIDKNEPTHKTSYNPSEVVMEDGRKIIHPNKNQVKVHISRYDYVPDEWKCYLEDDTPYTDESIDALWKQGDGGRHDMLVYGIVRVGFRERINRDSLLRWGLIFNELMCWSPKPEKEVIKIVDWVEANRPQDDKGNNDTFIPWKRPYHEMQKTTGHRREMLLDGFDLIGLEVRFNVAKQTAEYKTKDKDEWQPLDENDTNSLIFKTSTGFVTGLKIIPKKEKSKAGRPKKDKQDNNQKENEDVC